MIHWFDLFVVFFLVIAGVWSSFRGFAREFFSILSMVGGFLVASTYYTIVAPSLSSIAPGQTAQEIAAFLLLFFMTIITVVVTGIMIRRLLHTSKTLGTADKIAGFGMGIVKGGLILAFLAYPVALVPGLKKEFGAGSLALPVLVGVSEGVLAQFAPGIANYLKEARSDNKNNLSGGDETERVKKAVAKLGSGFSEHAEEISKSLAGFASKLAVPEKQETDPDKNSSPEERARKELDRLIETVDP